VANEEHKYTPEEARDIERQAYILLDNFVGSLLEVFSPREWLTILVSDHGAVGYQSVFKVSEALKRAGLLVTKPRKDGSGETINLEKSKAVPQRYVYIYVNLKGRDATGIVEPEDYDQVVNEIIAALYDYTDPATGRKPVALALRREDARLIGLKGDRIGDVVYAIGSGFGGTIGGVHGVQISTATSQKGDMRSLLVMAGPGIKKGCPLERTVRIEDIVPTICYLTRIPVPAQAEGGVIYQALEDPEYLHKEIDTLRKNYARLENAYKMARAQTHSYGHD